jgi:hypothetical protein
MQVRRSRLHLFTTDEIRFAVKSKLISIQELDMRQGLALLFAFLFIAATAAAQYKSEQDKKDEGKDIDRAQLVTTAEIIKLDAKKRTLQVKELVQPTSNGGRENGSQGRPNGGYGGGRRRNGGGFPGGGGGRYPGGGGTRGGGTTPQPKEYKVWVTKDTVLKLADTNIEFKDLHVGDRVTVSGFPKGSKDLEARKITRNFQ